MSELQISLLAIGALVVLGVYGYGAWQQRRYRGQFGSTFQAQTGDALYQGVLARKSAGLVDDSPHEIEHFMDDGAAAMDEASLSVTAKTDYIAVIFAGAPLHSLVLAPVWQRRFDFGKNLHVCGVPAGGRSWEKVVAESQVAYDTLRISLQLADRSGAVSQTRLEDFRDLLRDTAELIPAEVNLPNVEEAAAEAQKLDAFCAEVDKVIGLNILPSGEKMLTGAEIAQLATRYGMVQKADGMFHLCDEHGQILFSLGDFDGEPFRFAEMDDAPVIGLSLQMDMPRVVNPARCFDEMLSLARAMGDDLQAEVVDDNRMPLNENGVSKIRSLIAALEKRMQAYDIVPGSVLSRRLFS